MIKSALTNLDFHHLASLWWLKQRVTHVFIQRLILFFYQFIHYWFIFDTHGFGWGFLVLMPRFPLPPYSPPEENSLRSKETWGTRQMLNTRKAKKLYHYDTEGELACLFCAVLHGWCLKIKADSKLYRRQLCNTATGKKMSDIRDGVSGMG